MFGSQNLELAAFFTNTEPNSQNALARVTSFWCHFTISTTEDSVARVKIAVHIGM
jgi:hypothetical protein